MCIRDRSLSLSLSLSLSHPTNLPPVEALLTSYFVVDTVDIVLFFFFPSWENYVRDKLRHCSPTGEGHDKTEILSRPHKFNCKKKTKRLQKKNLHTEDNSAEDRDPVIANTHPPSSSSSTGSSDRPNNFDYPANIALFVFAFCTTSRQSFLSNGRRGVFNVRNYHSAC